MREFAMQKLGIWSAVFFGTVSLLYGCFWLTQNPPEVVAMLERVSAVRANLNLTEENFYHPFCEPQLSSVVDPDDCALYRIYTVVKARRHKGWCEDLHKTLSNYGRLSWTFVVDPMSQYQFEFLVRRCEVYGAWYMHHIRPVESLPKT